MTVRHVMKVSIDIKMMMINVNALQDIMMMAQMKNVNHYHAQRKHITVIINARIVIIHGILI